MKVKFQVPASLKDIPLKDYIAYQKILDANEDAQDSEFVTMKMVSTFCNVSYEDLQKLSLTQYDVVVQMLQDVFGQKPTFRNRIKIGDTDFGFIPKLDDISLGEYVDLENYMKSPTTYHKAMAVLYRPVTLKVKETYLIEDYEGSDKYAEFFLDCDLETTLGAMLFFWNLGSELLSSMKDSFREELTTTNTESDHNLDNDLAGINQSIISQMETSLELMKSQSWISINVCLN
jgi:hypothetical protein|tara:strand:+ start:254 stop:949 length:696 start_codon:yes stop_codon:yes gene_type:complete